MTQSHEEVFQRYIYAGAISRDPDAIAALFTPDGVYESPLLPAGHPLPRRLAGREAIRAGIGAYHREPSYQGQANLEQSRYVLHDTADPDVFIAEIDAVFDAPPGGPSSPGTMSLVQIFRVRDGLIVQLRDYFADPS